ncbi:hypothetical protein ABD87_14715 [Lysinibacillus sphaericus]|uniref:hypothetical protein n=1 Tax=Lysinibacillus sphaericus TaxID=1421 RepID=UPI0018CE29A5|nr:hypothetical protein [Lysinibacillus sphaericus]MBG9730752.1 hypothetical protein [Lysinibacillus sphaericus]
MKEIMATRKHKIGSVWLMERDIEILELLFQYRALLPEQLADFYGISVEVMRKRMNKLCNIELIMKKQLKGYRVDQSRQGVVYFIATQGLKVLRNNPPSVGKLGEKLLLFNVSNIRVSERHLPYVLTANDLGLELQNFDWEYVDSRVAKEQFGFNRNLLLHALFRDVEGREMFYYGFKSKLNKRTSLLVANEIADTSQIQNVLITTKGIKATEMIHEYSNPLRISDKTIYVTSNVISLKVMDFDFAKLYFSCFTDDESVIEFVATTYPKWLTLDPDWLSKKNMPYLNTVANINIYNQHQQLVDSQKAYIINMLDVDLVKIKAVQQYTVYEKEREKLNVLLLVTEHQKPIVEKYFTGEGYLHIQYFVIPNAHIERYRDEFYEMDE